MSGFGGRGGRVAIGLGVVAFGLAVVAGATLFTVEQTEQVLLTQLGQPVRVIKDPGLHVKRPFIQTALSFDRRLLDFELAGQEVILGDQRRLIVDCFARFRIVDPLRYFQAVGADEAGIRARLGAVVSGSLRRVLGSETLVSLLSADRDRIMSRIQTQVDQEMSGFGVSVEDVRIRRADLPEANTQAILSRMQSERERVAKQARAEGAEAAARIRAEADRDRTVLLANARAEADRLRGEGEQAAIGIYAAAFKQDPDFFTIWRTLQAYRDAFAPGGQDSANRLVLTPDSPFLRLLQTAPEPGSNAAIGAAPGPR